VNRVDLDSLDFFSPEVLEHPFAVYRQLQAEAPVFQLPNSNVFLVTRYSDVREVLRDHQRFSNDFGELINADAPPPAIQAVYERGFAMVETLLTQDPPRHKVYRSLVNKVFSQKRIEGMRPDIEALANALIDEWIADGEVDLLNRFCVPLPIYVIADQLGVPRQELHRLKRWSDAATNTLGQMTDEGQQLEDARAIVEFQHYFADLIDALREHPEDNIISDLANARIDEGRQLTKPEALGMLQQILVAGNETSTSAIAGGVLLLMQNPHEQQRLRDDPGLIPAAVEEILRLETPTSGMWRRVTQDTSIAGVPVPAGAMLMVRYAAANRDESLFPDGQSMDVSRENAAQHLAFGQGVHFCLGAMLARMEIQVALAALLTRTEHWSLVEGEHAGRHHPNVLLRGLRELTMAFNAIPQGSIAD